jgi:hypothetical protein
MLICHIVVAQRQAVTSLGAVYLARVFTVYVLAQLHRGLFRAVSRRRLISSYPSPTRARARARATTRRPPSVTQHLHGTVKMYGLPSLPAAASKSAYQSSDLVPLSWMSTLCNLPTMVFLTEPRNIHTHLSNGQGQQGDPRCASAS